MHRTLDVLIRHPSISTSFGSYGETVKKYLLVVLTDPRGWNLRNNICHGLPEAREFGTAPADRLMHIIVLLSLLRQESEATKPKEKGQPKKRRKKA